ncbi:MAG: glycosyltransferase [Patescibacteria group bacterium]|nr:glycosyltransferase [Patescibacteria group bacterium]
MNKKIKIIHILSELKPAGAEHLVLDLVKNLDPAQFEIQVWAVVGGGELEIEFKKLNINVQVFNKKTKLGLGVLWQMYRKLKIFQPNIVHTHLFAGDMWGKVASRLAGIKNIISTEHNIDIDEGQIKKKIKRWTYKFTSCVVAVSQAVKNYTIQTYQVKTEKIQVIYNGIDLNKFTFCPREINQRQPIIGTIARLEPQKGQEFLIQAFQQVLKKYPQANLWIIGYGSLEGKLKKQVADLNLDPAVKFWGGRMDIIEKLKQLDIFVLASEWEGLGIALIEAMASGLPVIGTRVGGIPELIQDGETGLLVKSQSVEELSQAIIKLLDQPELSFKLGQQASQVVKQNFDIQKMVKAYKKIYENFTS